MNIRFLIISLVLLIVIIVSEYMAYASFHTAGIIKSQRLEIFLMTLGIIMPIVFIVTMIYSYKNYNLINSWVNVVSAIWLAIIFYIFIASLVIFILIMIKTHLGINIPIKIISEIFVFLALLLTAYGVWNSDTIHITNYEIDSPKLHDTWFDKKIVIVSDIHLGNAKRDDFANRVVDKINKENPDVVFILGDLIEASSFPYKDWMAPFDRLNPPLGVMYVEGNHEKFSQEYDVFKSNFPKNINDITNKKIILNNTQIIGIDYKMWGNKNGVLSDLKKIEYNPEIPSIVLVHGPKDIDALVSQNVSLTLSGHTHSGQFFPFTLIVDYLYKNRAYGISEKEETTSLTTSGVGTSMIPLRINTKSEIVVLKIK